MNPIEIKSPGFDQAVQEVFEVFMFELWLRYYYVVEVEGGLRMEIPDEVLAQLRETHPGLLPLAEMMNHDAIDQQRSHDTVCSFVGARLDNGRFPADVVPRVFDSKAFKIENYVLSLWLKGHESYLDEAPLGFDEWREMYAHWKQMDEVQAYLARLEEGVGASVAPGSDRVH
ncbi:MAG: hypothetical protein AB7D57_14780 [Desulfovibrionaceae bacterium]